MAQIEDFKGAVVFAFGFQLPLHADHALSSSVDGELAQVADHPLAPQFFCNGSSGAGAAEEVGHQVAFVGRGFDNAFEQSFGFLGSITGAFACHRVYEVYVNPNIINYYTLRF